MARPLRIERLGGRYHVTARGNERKAIFRDDTDRFQFLKLLAELSERFGVKIHAYVLMNNHFHLLLETPEANLSRSMQWVGVSYSVWFNRRHQRAGHLFQGRFQAQIIEDDAGWQEVARYVHLNPVRVVGLGLGKRQRAASRVAGAVSRPAPELLADRLGLLRQFRWSSYRGYAGYCSALSWVCGEPLARLCGGRTESERRGSLREYTEQAVRQGALERPWDRLVAGMVLGSQEFARSLRRELRGNAREQGQLKELTRPVQWSQIVSGLEGIRGEKWEEFRFRHGDWGRDAALWLGRRQARLSLCKLGELAGGMDYGAVSQAIRRFGKRLDQDTKLRGELQRIEKQMSNVEM